MPPFRGKQRSYFICNEKSAMFESKTFCFAFAYVKRNVEMSSSILLNIGEFYVLLQDLGYFSKFELDEAQTENTRHAIKIMIETQKLCISLEGH